MHRRCLALLPILLLAAACGDDTLTIHGWLEPGSDATDVYVVGEPIRAVIEADSFVIQGIEGAVAELEFAEGDDRRGRMRVEAWSDSPLELRRMMPSALELVDFAGVRVVTPAAAAHRPTPACHWRAPPRSNPARGWRCVAASTVRG